MSMNDLTRPIVGIENRTAQEVFDIMADRIRSAALSTVPSAGGGGWLDIDEHATSGERILLLWKPVGGLSEHVELGRFSQAATGWVNTYGKPFHSAPDKWAPLAPFHSPPASEAQVRVEAAEAGWNACRKQVYLLSEDYIERTHPLKGADTVEGNFYRGQYDVAKSFAKAFNAFEAQDCDYFKQIDFNALSTPGQGETPPSPETQVMGIELAVRFVEKRLHDYVSEHGVTDPDTGTVEYPGNGEEYVYELEEIIEGICALATDPENKP